MISSAIRSLLDYSGKKQASLLEILDVNSKQSLSNKFTNERWSAEDLAKIADYLDCELAFILPDGRRVSINAKRNPDA